MNEKRLVYIVVFMFVVVAGCGYRLSGGGPLPGNVTRVAVAMFENRSFETGAEAVFTSALMTELVQSSDARVVDRGEAEAVIFATIKSITLGALSRTSDDAVVERQVSAVLDLKVVSKDGETIWSVQDFSESEVCTVSDENVSDEAAKREAVREIADRVSERIISKMRDNF
jgi:outer membrane lipopolysaccharide assembly protein LptE/RlpB